MPLYFFHLNFGHRVLPDEEGVELPNRSAAREEALAVVRDLADPKIGGNTRRWASWFLQVSDDEGQFFRTPVGHPALEIVGLDALSFRPKNRRPSNVGQPGQRRLCQMAADRRLSFGSFWRVSNTPHNCWNAIGSYGRSFHPYS